MSSKPFINNVTSALAVQAEKQFIGAIILLSMGKSGGRKELETISFLSPNDFWDENNALIYRAMTSLLQSTMGTINQLAVEHEVARLTNNAKALCSEISLCVAECYTPFDYLFYAQEIKNLSNQRHGVGEPPRFRGGAIL